MRSKRERCYTEPYQKGALLGERLPKSRAAKGKSAKNLLSVEEKKIDLE